MTAPWWVPPGPDTPTPPAPSAPVDPTLFTPSGAQIQALLPARNLSATSTPTITAAQQRAADIAAELAGEMTGTIPVDLIGLATSVVLYKTAADIEAGSWPEQQFNGAAASGGIWYARYVEGHQKLITLLAEYGDKPTSTYSVEAVSLTALGAAWMFPEAQTGWTFIP